MRPRAMRRCCRLSAVHSDLRRMHSAPDPQAYSRCLRRCCHPGSPACFRYPDLPGYFHHPDFPVCFHHLDSRVRFRRCRLKRICGCLERAGSFVDEALLIFRKILCQKLLCLRESISQRLYAFFCILIDRIRAEKFPGCLPSALQKHFSVI